MQTAFALDGHEDLRTDIALSAAMDAHAVDSPPRAKRPRASMTGAGGEIDEEVILQWADAIGTIGATSWPLCRRPTLPVHILPHLLLGDAAAAADVRRLRALGVTLVLDVGSASGMGERDGGSGGVDCSAPVEDVRRVRLPGPEGQDDEPWSGYVEATFEPAWALIEEARAAGGACLVHCEAGSERSAAIAVAAFMLHSGCDVLDAVRHCQQARGEILSDRGLQVRASPLRSSLPGPVHHHPTPPTPIPPPPHPPRVAGRAGQAGRRARGSRRSTRGRGEWRGCCTGWGARGVGPVGVRLGCAHWPARVGF